MMILNVISIRILSELIVLIHMQTIQHVHYVLPILNFEKSMLHNFFYNTHNIQHLSFYFVPL